MKLITLSIVFMMYSALTFSQSVEEKIVVKNITYTQPFSIDLSDGIQPESSFKTTFF
jgi:hypothetical protein